MTNKTEKKLIFLTLACVFLVMLILNFLTPMIADDYSYSFGMDGIDRIESLGDIFHSLAAHRVKINGRMLAHFFAYLFLMLPRPIFNFCNALVSTLLTAVLFLFYRKKEAGGSNLILLLCSVFLIWLFTPVFGQVFLWLDGSVNYSWAGLFLLAFLYPFYSAYVYGEDVIHSTVGKILFAILAFAAGSYSESASCAVLFILFLLLLLIRKDSGKFPAYLLFSFLCGCAGFLFLMTSPSELGGRTSDFSLYTIAQNIQRIVQAPYETLLILYCCFAALLAAGFALHIDRKILTVSIVFFLGSCASLGVFAVAAYFPWRSLFYPMMLLLLPTLILAAAIGESGQKLLLPCAAAVSFTCFIFSFILGVGDIAVVYSQFKERETLIYSAVEAGEKIVEIPQFSANYKYSAVYLTPDAYEDFTEWPNYDMERYYGISVSGIPADEDAEY